MTPLQKGQFAKSIVKKWGGLSKRTQKRHKTNLKTLKMPCMWEENSFISENRVISVESMI